MTETPGAAEPLPTPERLLISPNSALQIRLYLGGEAVKYPPVKVEQVTIEGVKEQHGRNEIDTMKKLGVCATYEGHQEWSQGEKGKLSHNAKVSSWASEVEGVFKKEGTKPHLEILKEIKTLGGIDLSSINQETAHKLYERYVKGEFNIKRFVDDLIAAHTENGVVNYSRLQSHLPSLTFLAGMFGKNTSLLLHDYLTAHIKFTKDTSSQQAFLKEVNTNNRINTLTPQEDQRLKWFFETSTQTKVVTVEAAKPIIPTKKEPTKTIEPIVIEPKEEPEKDFKIEEKPKVFVIEPPEIPDYSKLQKDERLNNLPGDTLRSAQFFCDNLRKRIQENGIVQQMKGPNNEDLLDITDPVTKKMNMTVGKREYVENGWFHSQGFIDWATENGLPLAYLVPGGNHAQILLKLENRGGKNGCVFYDPLSSEGEQWRELARQSSLEEYINDQIRQGKLKRNVIEIDNEKITQYIKPAIHEPYFSSEERVASDRELFEEWLHYVMPVQIHLNVHALDFLSQNRFDLTLENDSDFPDHIRQGKIQKVQFDGKNCVPISFFMNAVRYAAKPGDNEFKKRGIAKFLEDFGVRILTREEILG